MKRNKLWYVSKEQKLYPLLSTDSPYHTIDKFKTDAKRHTGASASHLNGQFHHYIISDEPTAAFPDHQVLYIKLQEELVHDDELKIKLQNYGLNISKKLPDERLFLFRMFHLKALVWSRINKQLKLIGKPKMVERNQADLIIHDDQVLSEIIVRQAELIAARALYTVGLDIGSVLLAISGTGTIAIRRIFPLGHTVITHDDEREIKKAMRQWHQNHALYMAKDNMTQLNYNVQQSKPKKSTPLLLIEQHIKINNDKVEQIKSLNDETKSEDKKKYVPFLYEQFPELWFGADPEFVLADSSNSIIPAVDVLKDDPLGRYGIDTVISNRQITFPVVEVRPDPQQTPQELYDEIELILLEIRENGLQQEYNWLAGGMAGDTIALGGHLHFSGVPITSSLLKMLDCFVGIPFALTQNLKVIEQRKKRKYGGLGDFRRQEHGGFEYRTLSSWLLSSDATKAVLALAYLVVKERNTINKLWHYDKALVDAFTEERYEEARRHSLLLTDIIEKLPSYHELADWIRPLYQLLRFRNQWAESIDFKQNWDFQLYTY